MDTTAEYSVEDASTTLLLIGSEDDGKIDISVQEREPVVLNAEQAEEAGRRLLARAGKTPASQTLSDTEPLEMWSVHPSRRGT